MYGQHHQGASVVVVVLDVLLVLLVLVLLVVVGQQVVVVLVVVVLVVVVVVHWPPKSGVSVTVGGQQFSDPSSVNPLHGGAFCIRHVHHSTPVSAMLPPSHGGALYGPARNWPMP